MMKKEHNLPFGLYNALLCLLAAAAAVLLCLTVDAAEEKWYLKWDVSDSRLSQLSDYTRHRLDILTQDVTLYPVYDASGAQDSLRDLQWETMLKMAATSPRVHVEEVDPIAQPQVLQSLAGEIGSIPNGTVFVRNGSGTRTIRLDRESFLFSRRIEQEIYTIYCGEAMLIGAIDRACTDSPAAVWFLTGHGEADEAACGQLSLQLLAMGYEIHSGTIAAVSPQAGDVVMLLGPRSDLTQLEADTLAAYLDAGGSLTVALGADESTAELPVLSRLLDLYGLSYLPGWVVEHPDETQRYVDRPEWLSPALAAENPVLDALPGRLILPRAAALRPAELRPGVTVSPLLNSSNRAVRKADPSGDAYASDPDDVTGPALLALMAEGSSGMHMLQLGSVAMLLDGQEASGAQVLDASENLGFLAACIASMTGQGEAPTLDAGVKQLPNQLITFDSEQTRQTVSILLLTALPGALTVLMAAVMLKRRRM